MKNQNQNFLPILLANIPATICGISKTIIKSNSGINNGSSVHSSLCIKNFSIDTNKSTILKNQSCLFVIQNFDFR